MEGIVHSRHARAKPQLGEQIIDAQQALEGDAKVVEEVLEQALAQVHGLVEHHQLAEGQSLRHQFSISPGHGVGKRRQANEVGGKAGGRPGTGNGDALSPQNAAYATILFLEGGAEVREADTARVAEFARRLWKQHVADFGHSALNEPGDHALAGDVLVLQLILSGGKRKAGVPTL